MFVLGLVLFAFAMWGLGLLSAVWLGQRMAEAPGVEESSSVVDDR